MSYERNTCKTLTTCKTRNDEFIIGNLDKHLLSLRLTVSHFICPDNRIFIHRVWFRQMTDSEEWTSDALISGLLMKSKLLNTSRQNGSISAALGNLSERRKEGSEHSKRIFGFPVQKDINSSYLESSLTSVNVAIRCKSL